jgi:hypothetical protein
LSGVLRALPLLADGVAEAFAAVGSVIGDLSLDFASCPESIPGTASTIDAASRGNLAGNRKVDRSEYITKGLVA